MRWKPLLLTWLVVVLLGGAAPAAAIEPYTYIVSLSGGIGGSFGAEPGDGLGHTGFQLGLAMLVEERSLVVARLGQLDLDPREGFGTLLSARLRYATVGGEYRVRRPLHESGVFLGLGAYNLDGRQPDGTPRDQTAVGATFGITGDFRVTTNLSFLVELAGHWADLDEANVFGMIHAGLALKF